MAKNGFSSYFSPDNTTDAKVTTTTGNFAIWIGEPPAPEVPAGYYNLDVRDPTTNSQLIRYEVGVPAEGQIGVLLFPPTSSNANCHD